MLKLAREAEPGGTSSVWGSGGISRFGGLLTADGADGLAEGCTCSCNNEGWLGVYSIGTKSPGLSGSCIVPFPYKHVNS
jgi:hypothetical protein